MDEEHLRITARERQALVEQYRKGANCRVRLRAHIILLLAGLCPLVRSLPAG